MTWIFAASSLGLPGHRDQNLAPSTHDSGVARFVGRITPAGSGLQATAVDILVRDRKGLAALGRLDELGISEAYMAGSLDVVGDMLRFVGLRAALNDSHPLDYLWRRLAPWLIGRFTTNRQAIATHYELDNDFYLEFLDPTRCYSQALYWRFRLYLWGSAFAFLNRGMEAYRVVLERPWEAAVH